jgi:hypothetical protein
MEEVQQKKRSAWWYVGGGCLGTIVLGCFGTLLMGKLACSSLQQYGEDLKDEAKQEAKAIAAAKDQLGGSPKGYYPVFSFGVPFVMDLIVFIDQKPEADAGGIAFERALYFMRLMETDQSKRLRDYFEKSGDASSLREANIQVQIKEELARGSFTLKDRKVFWVSGRGKTQMQGPYEDPRDGIITAMLFDCPKDGKIRIGTWQMRDDGQTDLKGTVADAAEIQKLVNPLSPCGK